MILRARTRSRHPITSSTLLVCSVVGSLAGSALGIPPSPGRSGVPSPKEQRLVYSASLPKQVFQPGEPIPLALQFENRSKEPVTLWICGFWPNHLIIVTDERGEEPPLTDTGKVTRAAFAPGGPRDKNSPHVLGAGKIYQDYSNLNLDALYRLTPGRYRARVTYHEPPLLVTSNTVAFEIKK